jgi:hypothetical protein
MGYDSRGTYRTAPRDPDTWVAERGSATEQIPPVEEILERAGGWSEILRGVDVSHQRAVLEPLAETIRLRRVGWGKYEAEVTWTKLGLMLRDLAAAPLSCPSRSACPTRNFREQIAIPSRRW